MDRSTCKGGGAGRERGTVIFGAALAVLFSVLYLRTLSPTVLYFDDPEMFDPAMLQAAAPVLGLAHPTGYPSYMMLAHLFTHLPFGDEAYRVSLVSAVFGVVAVTIVYLAGLRLVHRTVPAAAGALAFGLTPIFWSQAVIAEVYTVNAAFIASILYTLLLWRDGDSDRHLLLAAFLMGLSLTHHLTSALLVPAALIFVFMHDRARSRPVRLRRAGLWIRGAGLFALGLTPYLYLPVRAAMQAPLNEADPSTPERFLLLVSGGSFLLKNVLDLAGGTGGGGSEGATTGLWSQARESLERLSPGGEYVAGQFPALLLLAGVAGLVYLTFADRPAAALLGIPFIGWTAHAVAYTVDDFYIFFIPSYLVFALFISSGAGLALRGAGSLTERLPARAGAVMVACVCALALAVPLARVPETYGAEDRSEDYFGGEILDTVATETEPGATVLHHRSALWYMVLVEERRRDLTLVDPFETSWVRQTDLVWPDDLDAEESARRYGTDDLSGAKTARLAAQRGPVYLLDRDPATREGFAGSGFRVKTVDGGVGLYELSPGNEASRDGTSGDRRDE